MSQQRILIVDDEERVADALSRVLSLPQGGNYQVEWCCSGEAALLRLQETSPDLLITDLRMPGISGLELLERAHQLSPSTRSLLITAFGAPEIEAQVLRLANAYLPKPFTLATFLQTIQQALNAPPIVPLAAVKTFSADSLQAMTGRLDVLRVDTGAFCVLLPDCAGHLLAECGQHGEFDSSILMALLGNSMAAATEVGHLLNEAVGFDLHYHEGKHVEVYSAMVSDTIFIVLLFDRRAGAGRIGLVSLYMRRAIEDLRRMLSQTAAEPAAPLVYQSSDVIDEALDKVLNFQPDELFGGAPATAPAAPSRQGEGDRVGSASPAIEEADSPAERDGSLLTLEEACSLGLVNLNQLDAAG
ncbi:MAG TPA: response regulator [Anaerolineae bacterium]|nr:response regulator [Anaerolineae bacterium]